MFTCRITMKKSTPQAIGTLYLIITITQPPSCPIKLTKTNNVAKIFPQPQDMSIYSLCSYHWNHIRKPSSKNVDIKHSLATVGRTYFAFLVTCNKKWVFFPYGDSKRMQYIYCESVSYFGKYIIFEKKTLPRNAKHLLHSLINIK